MDWVLLATEAGEDKKEFTDLNFATALWVWIAFIATFLILRKVAWPIFLRKMEERENRIAEGLKKAEEAEARAADLVERQEQILDESRKEAQRLLAESRAAAETAKTEMLASAQAEIGAERERAKKEISLERAKAVDDLQKAAVDLTLEASARLLKRQMTDEDHRRLARDVVAQAASEQWVVGEVATN